MGWAEDLRAQDEEQRREAGLRMANQANYDPDLSARIFGVSAATNLPQEVVAGDIDGLEESLRTKSFNYDNYTDKVNGSPIFNNFAKESPYNFAVLDRDREGMIQIERSANDLWLGYKQGRATTQLADLRTQDIASGGSTPEQIARMDELRQLLEGGDFGAEGAIMKTLVGFTRQAPIQVSLLAESIDEAMLGGTVGATAGGLLGAGATAPIGGAGAIPGVLAGWTAGIGAGFYSGRTMAAFNLERGLAFDQYMEAGFDRKDALLFANAVGGVNAALESLGLGALTKRIPGFRKVMKDRVGDAVAEIFAQPTIKHAIARGSIQYGEGLITEVLTEIAQDTTLMLAEEHMKRVARDVSGDIRPEMAMGEVPLFEMWKETAIHTIYGSLILSSAGPIMNYKADARRARNALSRQESWARLKEGVDESTTKKEAKSVWDEFVARMTKDGPVKEVRYSRQAWTEYWQSKKIDPAEAAADLGIDLEALNVLDDDIVIPFDVFVDKIVPTDHFTGLQNDLRVTPDSMTARESRQWFTDQDEIIKAVRLQVDETGDHSVLREMEQDLTGMLISGGRFTKEAAAPQAEMLALKIYNLATQESKDPKKLMAQYLQGIRRQVPESLAGKDINMDLDPLLDMIREGTYPRQREIYGDDLIAFMRGVGGIQDEGGEMAARDIGKLYPGLISTKGKSIDAMAEVASEAGFISEYDSNLFLEALDKQLLGSPVYSVNTAINVELEELLSRMEKAAQFLDEENIDITNMSNAEVRKYMEGIQTLDQSDPQTLKDWGALLVTLTMAGENLATGVVRPNKFDTLLSQAEAMRPRVAGEQDFSSVTFTDEIIDEQGNAGTFTRNAQVEYDDAVNKRKTLKQLLDCVNG